MPLKQTFTNRGLPGWYSWVVVVGGGIMANVLTLIIALNLANNAVDKERQLRLEADERARVTACSVITAQDDAWSDPAAPVVTPAGKKAATAWDNLRTEFRCDSK